jgi:RNA polymerase primary sigma factor
MFEINKQNIIQNRKQDLINDKDVKKVFEEISELELESYSQKYEENNEKLLGDCLDEDQLPVDASDMEDDVITDNRIEENYEFIYSEDSVMKYLKEIGNTPLLTKEAEQELAAKIESGDQSAKEKMTNANLRLVVSVARRYVRGSNMALMDLIQEGNIGLMKAVDRFDFHKGYKFSTYAMWWIRQAITRAIADQARIIRIPVHMKEQMNKIRKVSKEIMEDTGREPTIAELAKRMNISEERMNEIAEFYRDTVSLETPVGEEEDAMLKDFVADKSMPEQFSYVEHIMLREQLNEIMSVLTAREQRVLRLRFGFVDGRIWTLEEVGKEYHLTRERIRQIEANALKKLKMRKDTKKLRTYLDI